MSNRETKSGQERRPKRGRPANLAEPTREKLVVAALQIFNEDGYFGTNTNKIAQASGFAPATFYRHFPDKKSIFVEAYSRWVAGDWEIIEAAASKKSGDAAAIGREITRGLIKRHKIWVTFRRSMHALVAIDESVRGDYHAARNRQLDRLAALIERHGAPTLSRADLLYQFLCVERVLNAATDGDLAASAIRSSDFTQRIAQEFEWMLSPTRGQRPV